MIYSIYYWDVQCRSWYDHIWISKYMIDYDCSFLLDFCSHRIGWWHSTWCRILRVCLCRLGWRRRGRSWWGRGRPFGHAGTFRILCFWLIELFVRSCCPFRIPLRPCRSPCSCSNSGTAGWDSRYSHYCCRLSHSRNSSPRNSCAGSPSTATHSCHNSHLIISRPHPVTSILSVTFSSHYHTMESLYPPSSIFLTLYYLSMLQIFYATISLCHSKT